MIRDRQAIYAAAFLRALATGLIGVLLGLHLAALHFAPGALGLVVSAGLAGAALATLAATLAGDRIGRRRMLLGVALLGTVGGAGVAVSSELWVLAAAAFLGMVNGMGRDRAAGLVLEQAILPSMVSDAERTRALAAYNVVQDIGHALGALMAGLTPLLREAAGLDAVTSLRVMVGLYAVLTAIPAFLYLRLSPAAEVENPQARRPLSPQTRSIVTRICALFGLDSLGGGFLTAALLAYFFFERFGVDESQVGGLFFLARVANALSHLGAAWLARRIGLVNTMVFTHIPSSLLLVTVAFAPSFPVAAVLFLLREGLVEMDVPTRQSYVLAVVRPEERTVASGLTHLVRIGAWAVAPVLAGGLMGQSLMAPLVVGAVMKVTYDVLLYRAFRNLKPPEEVRA